MRNLIVLGSMRTIQSKHLSHPQFYDQTKSTPYVCYNSRTNTGNSSQVIKTSSFNVSLSRDPVAQTCNLAAFSDALSVKGEALFNRPYQGIWGLSNKLIFYSA